VTVEHATIHQLKKEFWTASPLLEDPRADEGTTTGRPGFEWEKN
jgi:hypothetical protein